MSNANDEQVEIQIWNRDDRTWRFFNWWPDSKSKMATNVRITLHGVQAMRLDPKQFPGNRILAVIVPPEAQGHLIDQLDILGA